MSRATRRSHDRLILAIGLPALGALAADPLVSLVDTAFVGRLSTTALAALGIDAAIFGLAFFAFNFLAYGVTPLVATARGAGDDEQAARIISNALAGAVGLGILVTVALQIVAEPALDLMGASQTVGAEALGYLRIRALAAPAVLIITLGHGAFRGHQDTRTPLYVTLGFNLVNLVLDPLLIFGAGWGLEGAAVATLIAQWVGAGWFLVLLRRRLGVRFGGVVVSELRGLLRVGRDVLIRTSALLVTFTMATRVAATVGDPEVAAHQVGIQILFFLALSIDGLAIAAQSLIARFIGERRDRDAWDISIRLLELGAFVGVAFLVVLVLSRSVIPGWFTNEPEVLDSIDSMWWVLAAMQPLAALVYVWDGIVMGAAEFSYGAAAMVVSAIAAIGTLLLVVPLGWGLAGVWWGIGVLTIVRALTLGWWHFRPRGSLRVVAGSA
ncbi:MAG: MATE family efflux transporter [Acidimicrobiia bacterium]|nr:MATE family efflux transporter [Acidimicrobiia bacterium]